MHHRRLSALVLCSVICILTIIPIVTEVHAQDVASVWTTSDSTSTDYCNVFNPGTFVYIFWAPTGSSQDIQVTAINNDVLQNFGISSIQPDVWQIPSVASPGTVYWVVIPGVYGPYPISVATVRVAPESDIGSLVLVVVAFLAFGVFSVRKKTSMQRYAGEATSSDLPERKISDASSERFSFPRCDIFPNPTHWRIVIIDILILATLFGRRENV